LCVRCCSGQATSVTYSECVFVALFILHAKRKHHILLSSVACLSVLHFPIILIHGTIVGEKAIEHIDFLFSLEVSLTHFSFYEKFSKIFSRYINLHMENPLFYFIVFEWKHHDVLVT